MQRKNHHGAYFPLGYSDPQGSQCQAFWTFRWLMLNMRYLNQLWPHPHLGSLEFSYRHAIRKETQNQGDIGIMARIILVNYLGIWSLWFFDPFWGKGKVRSYSVLFIKGAFIIYEKGGGRSVKIWKFAFFSDPPQNIKFFFGFPPPLSDNKISPPVQR